MRWGLLRRCLHNVALALFVPQCGACQRPLPQRQRFALCARCMATLQRPLPTALMEPLHGAAARLTLYAPYAFAGALRELVHRTKFAGREDLGTALGELLAASATARSMAKAACCVVPVPLGSRRLRQRGFNQSAVIGSVLAREWGLPLNHALLRRRDTPAQSSLDAVSRRHNMVAAFAAARQLRGKVMLVDDVVTSGATAVAAAQACEAGGAVQVVVLAVARSSA